jgi:hypothetical protein
VFETEGQVKSFKETGAGQNALPCVLSIKFNLVQ